MSKLSKKMRIIFTLSVVLNVLLISVVVGHAMKRNWHGGKHQMKSFDHRQVMQKKLEHMGKVLPAEKQEDLSKKATDLANAKAEKYKELKRLRGDIVKTLKAEEFDLKTYTELSRQISALKADGSQKYAEFIGYLAQNMSQQDRSDLADALNHHPKYKFHKGKGKGKRDF